MPSRFYFSSNRPAEVSPTVQGAWTTQAQKSYYELTPNKSRSNLAEGTIITVPSGGHALDRVFVSPPLQAGSFSSTTVKLYLQCREYVIDDNVDSLLGSIYIVDNIGTTVRGTYFSFSNWGPTSEYLETGYRTKSGWDGDTGNNFSWNAGDRLVIELGHFCSGTGTTPQASAYYGSANAADVAENETQTTLGSGWVEFSNTISLISPQGTPSSRGARIYNIWKNR